MSSIAASSNPYLTAILLVTQARPGDPAQIIFHYPPDPFRYDGCNAVDDELDAAEDSSSESSGYFSDDADQLPLLKLALNSADDSNNTTTTSSSSSNARPKTNTDKAQVLTRESGPGSVSGQSPSRTSQHGDSKGLPAENENWQPPWHPLLGLGEENLVSLLAPGRTWHKRKFEMTINHLTFVGRPVYARENGTWSRRPKGKRKMKAKTADSVGSAAGAAPDTTSESDGAEETIKYPPLSPPLSPPPAATTGTATGTTTTTTAAAAAAAAASSSPQLSPSSSPLPASPKKALTMFHLVCVLDPPPLQQALRVREMYDHVAKRLSKVLKIDQAKTNYVWEQSELIQRLRTIHLTKADLGVDTYYSQVVKHSALANAIVSTYRAISQSQVAAVALSPRVSISMQIPPLTSTSYLPSLTEPPLKPGLWLTTVNQAPTSAHPDFDPASTSSILHRAKNTTLLLQESPQKILKSLQEPQAQGPLVQALTLFLDKLRSTKSFYALSIASRLSLSDIQLLARHLIYWRRAVAIPPLHHRDTYIVSPNADMSALASATDDFAATFPMAPSLPRFLHLLSQTPAPFGHLIPSSDHKEEYYRILAWLLRGGWVTQLCTFAYVRVDPRVKRAVQQKDKGSNIRGGAPATPSSSSFSSSTSPSTIATTTVTSRTKSSTITAASSSPNHDPNSASIILSPLRASVDESKWLAYIADSFLPSRVSSSSTSSSPPSSSSPSPSRSSSPPQSQSPSPSPSSSPTKKKQKEKRKEADASNSRDHDQDDQDDNEDQEGQELRKHWDMFVKYFNGSEALEFIPKREGLKRTVFWDLMGRMGLDTTSTTATTTTATSSSSADKGAGGNSVNNGHGHGHDERNLTGKKIIAVRHW